MAIFRPTTAAWLVLAAVYLVLAVLSVNDWRQGTRVGIDVHRWNDLAGICRAVADL